MAKKKKIIEVGIGKNEHLYEKTKEGNRLRHSSFTDKQSREIKKIYKDCARFKWEALELFERGFLMDLNPDNEIKVWKEIASHFRKRIDIARKNKRKITKDDKRELINYLIVQSTKKYPLKIEVWVDDSDDKKKKPAL